MIVLTMLLALAMVQAAGTEPAGQNPEAASPALETTIVNRESMAIRSSLRFENEVRPAFTLYMTCLNADQAGKPLYPDTIVQVTEDKIAGCVDDRAKAVAMGDAALKEAGWSRKRREAEIARTFDQVDADRRGLALKLRDVMIATNSPSSPKEPTP